MKPSAWVFAIALSLVVVLFVGLAVREWRRQRDGRRLLLGRYQARAARSPASEFLDGWVMRPYLGMKPEDVEA